MADKYWTSIRRVDIECVNNGYIVKVYVHYDGDPDTKMIFKTWPQVSQYISSLSQYKREDL